MESLRFLHYAFLFVTGYLIGAHYYQQVRQAPGRVQKRLLLRAARLFLVFCSANAVFVLSGLGPDWQALVSSCSDLRAVMNNCILNMRGTLFAYEILYYLGGFILLAGLTCRVVRVGPLFVLVLALQFLRPCNLARMLTIGMMGTLFGMVVVSEKRTALQHAGKRWLYLAPVLLLLQIVMSVAKTEQASLKVFIYALETVLWLSTFLLLVDLKPLRVIRERLALLGQYTLFAYLLQMPLARLLHVVSRPLHINVWVNYVCGVALMVVCVFGCVVAVDRLRKSLPFVDGGYRVVFS